jgi:hypothetical protein
MSMQPSPHPYNATIGTRYRAGWVGLFAGENQRKALERTFAQTNVQDLRCVGLVRDQWNSSCVCGGCSSPSCRSGSTYGCRT